MGQRVVGGEVQVLIHVSRFAVYLGRDRTIGVVPDLDIYRKDILPPFYLSDVNWMLWLMELIWANIISTQLIGTVDRTSSTYLFYKTVGTSEVSRA